MQSITSPKTVLKGLEWKKFLKDNNMSSKTQMELYSCTYNYTPVYKLGNYYFSFSICRGYSNLSSLKRLL